MADTHDSDPTGRHTHRHSPSWVEALTRLVDDDHAGPLTEIRLRLAAVTRTGAVSEQDITYLNRRLVRVIDQLRAITGDQHSTAERFSEWLHDIPLQKLTSVQLRLTAMTRTQSHLGTDLSYIAALVDAAIQDLRGLSAAAEDDAAAPPSLCSGLQALCARFEAQTDIVCRCSLHEEHLRLTASLSTVIFRSVRELLTNVRKHSRATAVTLTSGYCEDGAVFISVRDNGIGYAAETAGSDNLAGHGLISIEDALSAFDAFLVVDSDDGACATIIIPRHHLLQ